MLAVPFEQIQVMKICWVKTFTQKKNICRITRKLLLSSATNQILEMHNKILIYLSMINFDLRCFIV